MKRRTLQRITKITHVKEVDVLQELFASAAVSFPPSFKIGARKTSRFNLLLRNIGRR